MQNVSCEVYQIPCHTENKSVEEDMGEIHPLKFSETHGTSKLPLQSIENTVMCGDCTEWLDRIPDHIFDIIYIDPPFFTRTDYGKIWGNGWELAAWEDWKNSTKGDVDSFIIYMYERVLKMKNKLKETGTFWLHCDYRANYKFRQMLEDVFGGNFIAELVIKTTGSGTEQCNSFARQHDTIFVYSKNKEYFLSNVYFDKKMPKSFKYKDDKRGIYASGDMSKQGHGEARFFNGKLLAPPKGTHWRWSQERINKAVLNGTNKDTDLKKDFIFFTSNGVPRRKTFWLNKGKNRKLTTFWDDCIKNSWTEDKVQYPTKKPISLLTRIIEIACPKNGLIGDFFAGGGTTLLAAAKLKEKNIKYIGCDVSPVAIKAQNKRFVEAGLPSPQVLGFPKSKRSYLEMNNKKDKHVFEKFMCDLCGWRWLKDTNGQGKGFDAALDKTKTGFQIKNHKNAADIDDVRKLNSDLMTGNYDNAVLTAWDLTAPGFTSLSKCKKEAAKQGKNIDFQKLDYFLDCFLIEEEKEAEIDALLNSASHAVPKSA